MHLIRKEMISDTKCDLYIKKQPEGALRTHQARAGKRKNDCPIVDSPRMARICSRVLRYISIAD